MSEEINDYEEDKESAENHIDSNESTETITRVTGMYLRACRSSVERVGQRGVLCTSVSPTCLPHPLGVPCVRHVG